LERIQEKKLPVGLALVVAGLLVAVVALAAQKCPPCPAPARLQCLENGVGFGEKCFYFVEEEKDWNEARNSCLSHRARLATVDSQKELDFLLRYGSSFHHWLGLRREDSQPWTWLNGSLFND
ncbi:CLC2D protein, partial [Dasyornis broadbenti]|nr:CLC2D protein [Dasyornis broadbenti]